MQTLLSQSQCLLRAVVGLGHVSQEAHGSLISGSPDQESLTSWTLANQRQEQEVMGEAGADGGKCLGQRDFGWKHPFLVFVMLTLAGRMLFSKRGTPSMMA